MKLGYLAAAALALLAPAAAQAAEYVFDTNGCSSSTFQCSSSTLGGLTSATISARGNSSVKVLATAWQIEQADSSVNAAYLGAYSGTQGTASGGLGVTGYNDWTTTDRNGNHDWGGGNTHQTDNTGGYTDLILLQFNQSVRLTGANLAVYGIGGVSDSDMSFLNPTSSIKNTLGQSLTNSNWSSAIDLSTAANALTLKNASWTNADGSGSGSRTLNGVGFSNVWLVSASMMTTDRDDGFKISLLTVKTYEAPEPATWAMMILGFGAIGASMRRRRAAGAAQIA